jgi:hypothetical protein
VRGHCFQVQETQTTLKGGLNFGFGHGRRRSIDLSILLKYSFHQWNDDEKQFFGIDLSILLKYSFLQWNDDEKQFFWIEPNLNLKTTTREVEQWDCSQHTFVDWMCRDMVNARTPKEDLSAINYVNPNQEALSGTQPDEVDVWELSQLQLEMIITHCSRS